MPNLHALRIRSVTRLLLIALTAALLNVSGCATKPIVFEPVDQVDPFERFNRGTFAFNMDFDTKVMTPVANLYTTVLPEFLVTGIHNVFNNFAMIDIIINDLLQFEFKRALRDTWRLVFNTIWGLLGFFDHATKAGYPYVQNDLGQTLAKWGVAQGPYLMAPFVGPWTTRYVPGFIMQILVNPLFWTDTGVLAWPLLILRGIDLRVASGGALEFIRGAVGDPYTFMRDAYLQRREYLIFDGNPPSGDDDLFEELLADEASEPGEDLGTDREPTEEEDAEQTGDPML